MISLPTFISRVRDAFADPVRRRHVAARVLETAVPGAAVLLLTGAGWWAPGAVAALVLGELCIYEFLLEPIGWAGHYWERPARDGEVFIYP